MERYFEWDKAKAQSNYRKHGVSFKAATQVFNDPLSVTKQDRAEHGEYRWQTIGMVDGCLLLLVAHTVHIQADENDANSYEMVRLISARQASGQERKRYENGSI